MQTGPASHPSTDVSALSLTPASLCSFILKLLTGVIDSPDVCRLPQGSHQSERVTDGRVTSRAIGGSMATGREG